MTKHSDNNLHILVIDRANGPADVLMSTLDLLLECEAVVTTIADALQALCMLTTAPYDLVVIGNGTSRRDAALLRRRIHTRRPDLPVLIVEDAAYAEGGQSKRQNIVTLPHRAAELRALAGRVARRYLRA